MPNQDDPPSFEQSLEEFERLVERMEKGDLSLEEALLSYERGVQLSTVCQRLLDRAEQRIEILSSRSGEEPRPESFEIDEPDGQ